MSESWVALGQMASALLARLIVEEGEKGGAQFDDEHTRFILFQDPTLPNSRKAALGEGPSPQLGMVATFRAFWLLQAPPKFACAATRHIRMRVPLQRK